MFFTHVNAVTNTGFLSPRFQHFSWSNCHRILGIQAISVAIPNPVLHRHSRSRSRIGVSTSVALSLLPVEAQFCR